MADVGVDPVSVFQAQALLDTRRQQVQLREQLRADGVRRNDIREQQLIEERRRDDLPAESLQQRRLEDDLWATDLCFQEVNERLLRLDTPDPTLPRGTIVDIFA